jgi:hypothetical protein
MRGRNPAGQGPTASRRVGKSKKVVKRRGVGVLVFEGENCLEVKGGEEIRCSPGHGNGCRPGFLSGAG